MLAIALVLLALAEAPIDSTAPRLPNGVSAPPETTRRVVREFPAIEVRALIHDLRSSQTVHLVPTSVLRSFPVDRLADVLALQPGVIAQAEELHVRGGRSGETVVSLDGLALNEPFRHDAMDVPLLALRGAELVTGAPEAQYGGGLAGFLNLRTVDPGDRVDAEWRWQSDARLQTRFDRVGARIGAPLRAFGLGVVAAGDATLDDTWLPMLRTPSRHRVAGLSFGWRAENRLLGFVKLAPVQHAERFSAQVLVSREVRQPYNPSFTLDGWVYVPANLKITPTFSPVPKPGYLRYRSADHNAITDDRRIATLLKVSSLAAHRRAGLSLGWLRTRAVTSVSGQYEPPSASHRPRYGSPLDANGFYVLWGDYPLYRENASDVVTLRGDVELAHRTGTTTFGAGLTHDRVSMREMDWMPFGTRAGDEGYPFPLDSVRAYHARAPGAFAFAQGRWLSGGLVLNAGLRADYFTTGPEGSRQTLPGTGGGVWSIGPRLGLAYPISVRDVFSLGYVRVHQAPGRDFLYDHRVAISDRQPLGNPALGPAVLISYEAAVKHIFGPTLAFQSSVYYRDVFGQVGALDYEIPQGPINLRYVDRDESHALGFGMSLIHSEGERRRVEAHYVWLTAWGNESRPEGDPYGPVRSANIPPIGDHPMSWDRQHSLLVSGVWDWRQRWSVSWSSAILSPFPWTPKPRRQSFTDQGLINSRRLPWATNTNVNLRWTPPKALGLTLGLEARNVFNDRAEQTATLDGYPNPLINTLYDDYGAYRTETGLGGGGYWSHLSGSWVEAHDRRLYNPPRTVRASIGARW